MKRPFALSLLLGAIVCTGCSKPEPVAEQPAPPAVVTNNDKILVANAGSAEIKDLVIATSKGDVLWEGDLSASQQMTFNFTPENGGHFVVRYVDTSSQVKEEHKGYYTLQGGLLHSFTFRSDGTLKQQTQQNQPK